MPTLWPMNRHTKIVATLGPACDSEDGIRDLLRAGVDVVRLNLAHGKVDDHVERLRRVRWLADEIGSPVAMLTDLPGPKVRTASFPDGGVFLVEGAPVELVACIESSTAERIGVD